MAHILVHFVFLLYVLWNLATIECYTYASKPLFMSFSDLAALEANSLDQVHKPNSRPVSGSSSHFEDPVGKTNAGPQKKTVVVTCHKDSIEVVIKAYIFGRRNPVEPKHLRLGPVSDSQDHCTASESGSGEFTIRAALSECGTRPMVTEMSVLYNNVVLYTPPQPLPGGSSKAEGVVIPVQCEYRRRYTVSSRALRPTWIPLSSTQSALLHLDFNFRLMTDDWSNERKSSVYFLGDTVNIEATVDATSHLPLGLFVHTCTATVVPDVNSHPRYSFIDHQGCFTDSQLTGSSSRFLPRVQDELLQIQLEPFLFHQDPRHTIYVTCYLEAVPVSKRDPMKKACSFINGRWRSVDGDDNVCESCGRGEVEAHTSKPAAYQSNHKRALRSNTKHRANVEVVAKIAQRCSVREDEKLLCGVSDINQTACEALSCCFDGQHCFYGKSVTLHCTKAGQFVVVAARDITQPHLDLSSISLLGADGPCTPVGTTAAYAIYQFHVKDCGTQTQMDEGTVLYQNIMSSSYEVIQGPVGSVSRDSIYQLTLQCRYSGSDFVPLEASILNLPPPLPAKAQGPLNVELRLARDWKYQSYYVEEDYPVVKFLQRPVYVEVRILDKTDPALVLTLRDCWTTSSPNPNSRPQWSLIVQGCPYLNDKCLTRYIPVGGPSAPPNPAHYKRFVFYMFTFVDEVSLRHKKGEVFIHCSTTVCFPSPSTTCQQSCQRQRRDTIALSGPSSGESGLASSRQVIFRLPWVKV